MISRRIFLKNAAWCTAALSTASLAACKTQLNTTTNTTMPSLKISLAQWSLHRAIEQGKEDPNNFAATAINEYGINAVEYVNQFYVAEGNNEKFWIGRKKYADDLGVKSLLIMVDDEGDLGNPNDLARNTAVENHYKWVDAAKLLGCHSIRVNAFGDGTKERVRAALIDGMGRLSDYAIKENINVLIENHGLYSSDAKFITSIIKEANRPNFGTLPDFGNWCLNAKWGSTQNNRCTDFLDHYTGVSEFLPYAKGLSAKSYNFNAKGEETLIDYHKMLGLAKKAGYDGYIGIEYEGEKLSEPEGIRATKALLEKAWAGLS